MSTRALNNKNSGDTATTKNKTDQCGLKDSAASKVQTIANDQSLSTHNNGKSLHLDILKTANATGAQGSEVPPETKHAPPTG